MARTISDEELQLKRRARRRLIGAIVLVTAIVVVLPMVLDSEPKPVGREISVRIPSPDAGPFAGQIAPLPAQKDGKAAAKAPESALAAEGKASVATPQESAPAAEAKPVQAAPRKETAKPKPKPKPKPAKAAEGQFVVQVIALADADKARQMQERIAAAGIKSYTEIVKTAKGDVTRVRAGPFATRDAAEKAREQLKTLGMSGNIIGR
jgi:DedD protein